MPEAVYLRTLTLLVDGNVEQDNLSILAIGRELSGRREDCVAKVQLEARLNL